MWGGGLQGGGVGIGEIDCVWDWMLMDAHLWPRGWGKRRRCQTALVSGIEH